MLDAIRIKQLREAVPERRIVELQDVGPKRHRISCIPLFAGQHFTTVCEINPNIQLDRIISVPYTDIGVIMPFHSYTDFYEWCLERSDVKLPDEFPTGDSYPEILSQIRESHGFASVWKRDGAIFIGPILSLSDDSVTIREIDCVGEYIWEVEAKFKDIYRVDCGGLKPTLLWHHAEATYKTSSEQDAAGQPATPP